MIETKKREHECSSYAPNKPWVVVEGTGLRGSVAIVINGKRLIIESEEVKKDSKYSSSILPLIKKLLSKFSFTVIDIRGLILVNGPGSFTGLRVTNGLVHGLAQGLDCPVTSISTFEIYAFAWLQNLEDKSGLEESTLIDVTLDARLEEFFSAKVLCKKLSSSETSNLFNFNWDFSINEQPSILDKAGIMEKNLDNKTIVLNCPNILDFKPPDFINLETYCDQNNLFLAGWAALFSVFCKNIKWKLAKDIQPLYVRDRVAKTVLERKENPELIIEPFNFRDVETILSIEKDTYQFGWSKRNFEDSLNSKYICKKLINNSLLVGYFIWMVVEKECHILNFTIANGRQRRGLGQWMLSRLLASLQEFKLNSVFLEVRPSNKLAINLYGKNGFEIVGRRKSYYSTFTGREDALVMKRLILKKTVG